VRGRRDLVGRDLADAGDGAEDDVELAGEQVELTVGDGEPGEPGEVRDLVPADRAGESADMSLLEASVSTA
jgi:hypothetical protein